MHSRLTLTVMVLLSVTLACQAQNTWSQYYDFRMTPTSSGATLMNVVYEPTGWEVEEEYPLVIYLHGSSSELVTHERVTNEAGLAIWHGWGSNRQIEPTFLFAPVVGTTGFTGTTRRQDIFEVIDGLTAEFPIDMERIYISGFSMGAGGTWNYIQYRPNYFAAACPVGLNGGSINAQLVKDTPIWATIGADDLPPRVDGLEDNVEDIRAANGDPRGPETWVTGVNPKFEVFPNTGHGGAIDATFQQDGYREWFYEKVNDGNAIPNIYFSSLDDYDEDVFAEGGDLPVTVYTSSDTVQVEYFLGNDSVAALTDGTFDFTYTGLLEGEYYLYAKATDAEGKTATASQRVQVDREPGIPGDANRDGFVTDADYTVWADHYGMSDATWDMGDFNGNGAVTEADYTIWADNYGATAGEATVPEPMTLALLLALPAIRRRRG
jgi:dienelactone hydrolase